MEYILSYCHCCAALIFVMLGIFTIHKNPRSLLNYTCASVFGCLAIWSISKAVIHNSATSLEIAQVAEQIGSIGWIWFIFFFLWFAWLYTRKPSIRFFKFYILLFTLIPSILSYQQLINSALISIHLQRAWGWFAVWTVSFWLYLYISYLMVSFSVGIVWFISAMKRNDSRTFKRQTLVIVITGIVSMTVGTVINIILPIGSPQHAIPIADITALIWALGLAYAAIRYQLLDITPIIAAGRIIDVMKDLLFLLDLHGKIISVNNAAANSLACSEKRLIGYEFDKLIIAHESENHRIQELIKSASSYSVDTALALPPGPQIPVTLSVSLIPGSGIVCVAHDISLQKMRTDALQEAKKLLETEVSEATVELQRTNDLLMQKITDHKNAARSLKETEERFRVIFENAPDGIYLADKGGTLLDANKEVFRILGRKKATCIGLDIFQLGLCAEPSQEDRTLSPDEITIQRFDGTSLPAELSTHQVKISDQELTLGVIRDLTERKRTEAEAEQLKADLHQAQKMESIGQLASGIAHDFNNLLGGIMGYASILYRQLDTKLPDAAEKVSKIQKIAQQAKERTGQLLAFARKGKYQVEPVDMHVIISEVINLLEHTIDKNIILTRAFHAEQSIISGDRSLLYNAILNLAMNARDALPNGGIIQFITEQIEITAESAKKDYTFTVQPGTFLKVMVQDNGIGMDAATQARIFEPFFSKKEIGKGTGLGCASVYGTIKSHNGFIELESAPGVGTTFTISLPLLPR